MKRYLLIALFFVGAFSLLCLWGCGGPAQCHCGADSLTVGAYDGCSADSSTGDVTLSGCHLANSCIDCYWFPTACGYYENDLSSTSHVVCGWDCTFGECYGDSSLKEEAGVEGVPNVETRTQTLAAENEDYTIDDLSVTLYYGELESFKEDHLTLDQFKSILNLISMWGEETKIQLTLEYTALTELSGVKFQGDVIYDGYEWTNYTDDFCAVDGNAYGATDVQRRLNIQPGKHVINAVISLNFYEMKDLEDITNLEFLAYTYAEE